MLASAVRQSTRRVSALVCHQNGPALSSLKLEEVPVEASVGANQVRIKMLMAPINPADLNQVEGTYAFIPPTPFVAGNEGVGEVVEVGPGATSLSKGDWVIPGVAGLGTWRSELVCDAKALRPISKLLSVEAAATILVNPCTAYRMLTDFVALQPGQVVIQNGANSAVGRAVIQICKRFGIKTVNVVRDRPNFEALEAELKALGATMVVKAERLPLPETQSHMEMVLGGLKPVLALNCVGGQSATDLARSLGHGGTLVTYGGMSKKPVTIPTALLIFNDIRVEGFWVSAWYQKEAQLAAKGNNSLSHERDKMMADLTEMYLQGQLTMPPCRTHPLSSWHAALEAALSPYTGQKELFKFFD